jgi:two-component system response regulator ChvI
MSETFRDDGEDAGWNGSPRIRLLLVDDDELFREMLAMSLADEKFDVLSCRNGKACLEILYQDPQFDLILLDWRMPEMSGIEVLQAIKAAGIAVPVVFLTAFATERNEEAALDCGAVDFLDKTRSAAVMGRRIRILVGNGRGPAARPGGELEVLHLGPLDVHFRVNRAYWDGQLVPLTTTEFRVVQLLASRAGEDVSYRAIYDVVHGQGFIAGDGSNGYRTNVRSLIRRIRQKFREVVPDFDEIENYPGFGYRWHRREAEPVVNGQAAGRGLNASHSYDPWPPGDGTRPRAAIDAPRSSGPINGKAGVVPRLLRPSEAASAMLDEDKPQHDHRALGRDTT